MNNPLGAGFTRHRTGGPEVPSDTAFLGVLPREIFEAVGGYDPSMTRNQDGDLNWRLRNTG